MIDGDPSAGSCTATTCSVRSCLHQHSTTGSRKCVKTTTEIHIACQTRPSIRASIHATFAWTSGILSSTGTDIAIPVPVCCYKIQNPDCRPTANTMSGVGAIATWSRLFSGRPIQNRQEPPAPVFSLISMPPFRNFTGSGIVWIIS